MDASLCLGYGKDSETERCGFFPCPGVIFGLIDDKVMIILQKFHKVWTAWSNVDKSACQRCGNNKMVKRRTNCQFRGKTVADDLCPTSELQEEFCAGICESGDINDIFDISNCIYLKSN